MLHDFQPGDFLIFQLESGYALLRVLGVDQSLGETIWHLAAYNDLFLDINTADVALENPQTLSVSHPHLALTNRAFESTQVAKLKNVPLSSEDLKAYEGWNKDPNKTVSDRSVRLMLGLR